MNVKTRTRLARVLADGQWNIKAYSPLRISDPAAFSHELGHLHGRSPADRLTARVHRLSYAGEDEIALSAVRQILQIADREQRRRLERLLAGSRLQWEDVIYNLVVNQGLDDLLDVTLSGGTQDSTWFIGLTDSTPTVAAGDTPGSHAGWAEVTDYDEAARVAWSDGGVSGQSVDNSASPATFTISANNTTVGGAGLFGDNTKGGATGRLYAVGAFSAGDKTLDDNDSLDVTSTFTSADDGV